MKNKHTPYTIMKSSVDKKITPTKEEIKKINSFFLVRYVSNDPSTIYISNVLNCNSKVIPIEAQYNFIKNSTMDRVAFINYPKKEKMFLNNELKILMRHYKCNERIALDYANILGKDRVNEIVKKYETLKLDF